MVCYTLAMRRQLWADIGIAGLCGLLEAVIINWHGFIDPDAFYHATMSRLLMTQGPLHAFPWLDLTLFGQRFADIHLLFHAVAGPFVLAFGDLQGIRVASIVLAVLLAFVIIRCLRALGLSRARTWTILLFLTQPFAARIGLGKATPLALIWFVLGITLFWLERDALLALCAFAFALTHNAWAFLLGAVFVLAFGKLMYAHVVREEPWRVALRGCGWRSAIACLLGGLAGLAVHPNGFNVFRLSWTTLVSIGLATPIGHLPMGVEWLPLPLSSFMVWFGGWTCLIGLGLAGLLFSPRKDIGHVEGRLLTSLGWLMAVLTGMTLKSTRVVEYLAPVMVLFCAALWQCVDVRGFLKQRRLAIALALLILAVFVRSGFSAYKMFHEAVLADDIYATTTAAIAARAKPGDRVMNARWDDFPMLFHADRDVRYVSGLDPVLLHVASSTLSTAYNDLTFASATPTKEQAWGVIHDRLGARFVFLAARGQQRLRATVESDPRYTLIASSTDSWAYEIGQ